MMLIRHAPSRLAAGIALAAALLCAAAFLAAVLM
jgi:hypothetical protein